jgi:polygalacturonase
MSDKIMLPSSIGEINLQNYARDYVSVKDFGAVGDGVTDDTLAFKKAISLNKNLYVPDGIYIISDVLYLKNSIQGQQNSKIIRINNDGLISSRLLWLDNVENITISNLFFDSTWNGIDNVNEQGHCITLGGCKNITIKNCHISNFYGDGVYIGRGGNTHQGSPFYSENIYVLNCKIDNVYRGCITLISAINVYIENNILNKNIEYQAVIPCESNTSLVETIRNVYVFNNISSSKDTFVRLFQKNSSTSNTYKNIFVKNNNVIGRRLFMVTGTSNGNDNVQDLYIENNFFEYNTDTLLSHAIVIFSQVKENLNISNNTLKSSAIQIKDTKYVNIISNIIYDSNTIIEFTDYITISDNQFINGGSVFGDGLLTIVSSGTNNKFFITNNKFLNSIRGVGFKNAPAFGYIKNNYMECSDIAIDFGLTSLVSNSNVIISDNEIIDTTTPIRQPSRNLAINQPTRNTT